MEEGGRCWVWANHESCNPCWCYFNTTNLSTVADHYVALDTAPCQKAIVQEWLEEHKRKVFGIPFLRVTKNKKCLKVTRLLDMYQSGKTVERLSWCHLGSGAFLHCHLCDIYFPAGDCDADVRARVSVCTPVCLNQYEGVWARLWVIFSQHSLQAKSSTNCRYELAANRNIWLV